MAKAGWGRYSGMFFLVALLVIVIDQLSKLWITATISFGHVLFDLGFLRIVNIHNRGAAFGLFPEQSLLLTVIAFIGIPAVLLCAVLSGRCLPFLNNLAGKSALGLVLGGTVGNLIDRLRSGYVTDFIDFRIWPTFNIADSAITIGVIIIAYCLLRATQMENQQDGEDPNPCR